MTSTFCLYLFAGPVGGKGGETRLVRADVGKKSLENIQKKTGGTRSDADRGILKKELFPTFPLDLADF